MSFADTQLCRPTRFGRPIAMPQTAPKMASKFLSYVSRTIERVNKCLLDALKSYPVSYSISVSSAVCRISLAKLPTDDKMAAYIHHRLLRLSDVNVMKPKSTLSDRSDAFSYIVAGAPMFGVPTVPFGRSVTSQRRSVMSQRGTVTDSL